MNFLFLMIFLITFSLAYLIVRIENIIHVPYKIYVNQLFMLCRPSVQQQAINSSVFVESKFIHEYLTA